MASASLSYPVVCFGEILWDILPDKSLPGGAPMNVAYHLQKLGLRPALISRIGADDYGKNLVDMLSMNQLSTDFIQVDSQHDTGLVYARPGANNEVTYDIVYPSAWDFIEQQRSFPNLLNEAAYFVFGSLATRHSTSKQTLHALLENAQTKVLDINLRKPHYSQPGVEDLLQKADIVKLNETELQIITAWYGNCSSKVQQMQLLQDRFAIDMIIVTMGSEGAMVSQGGHYFYNPGYKVVVSDTIGSGDAFLAGFLSQLYNKASLQEALDFAAGLGALIATYPGACPAYDPTQITKLMMGNKQPHM
jgi:fructokinase